MTLQPFTQDHVASAPDSPGLYRLYRGEEVVCVGLAGSGATLRAALLEHLREEFPARGLGATAFDCSPLERVVL